MISHSDDSQAQLFGSPKAGSINRAAINHDDAVLFVQWLQLQKVPMHDSIFPVSIEKGFYSLTKNDVRWLCKAILQAENAPSVGRMRQAILSRDVGKLRDPV